MGPVANFMHTIKFFCAQKIYSIFFFVFLGFMFLNGMVKGIFAHFEYSSLWITDPKNDLQKSQDPQLPLKCKCLTDAFSNKRALPSSSSTLTDLYPWKNSNTQPFRLVILDLAVAAFDPLSGFLHLFHHRLCQQLRQISGPAISLGRTTGLGYSCSHSLCS